MCDDEHGCVIVVVVVLVAIIAIIATNSNSHRRGYRQGQIDALTGKATIELRINENGERVWLDIESLESKKEEHEKQ